MFSSGPTRLTKGNLGVAVVVTSGVVLIAECLRQVFASGLEAVHLAWLGLAILTLLAGRLSFELPLPHCRLSVSDPFVFLSVLVFGAPLGTLTAALDGFAASTRARGTGIKRAFNTAGMAVSVYLSAEAARLVVPRFGVRGAHLSGLDVALAVSVLALVHYVVNSALVSAVVALKEGASFLAIWGNSSPWAGTATLAASLAAGAVFQLVTALGPSSVFAILPCPLVLYLSYRASLRRVVAGRPSA